MASNHFDDSISSRISPSCPPEISQTLEAAWSHDIIALKPLINGPGKAAIQDPITRETPLHAAIRACAPYAPEIPPSDSQLADASNTAKLTAAKTTVHELFLGGAIWNDVDDHNETPGCVALRLHLRELYELCVDAGVRAELLFGLLEGYEELSSDSQAEGDDDHDEVAEEVDDDDAEGFEVVDAMEDGDDADAPELVDAAAAAATTHTASSTTEPQVNSKTYLSSDLTFSADKLTDSDGNGVMMAWETEIMRQSVDALLTPKDNEDHIDNKNNNSNTTTPTKGKRILNIGFGMGIIDTLFAATDPSVHHIIEAHEQVLARQSTSPDATFGPLWESRSPIPGAYKLYGGTWQDIIPQIMETGQIYDAIYFDTFGEDYSQLRKFFTEYVPNILDEGGVFGFFNGLGADRQICYDVYVKVVEMHMSEAGMDVEWKEVPVDLKGLQKAGEGEWEGVRRRYWTLEKYMLPICTFLG